MTNRRPNGTFIAGPGRPKGARNLLARKVFEDIFRHWSEPASDDPNGLCKGQAALEVHYREEPGQYLRLVAAVLPKEFIFEQAVSEMDDGAIDDLLIQLRDRMLQLRAEQATPLPQLEAREAAHEH